ECNASLPNDVPLIDIAPRSDRSWIALPKPVVLALRTAAHASAALTSSNEKLCGQGWIQMASGDFKDHFSGHSQSYREARPTYSPELFVWLSTLPSQRRVAWDVACGNGQASLALAPHFERVVATDASANQIASAPAHVNIDYRVEPAEASSLEDGAVDLVTVA